MGLIELVTVKIVLSSTYFTSPIVVLEVEDLRESGILAQLGLIKQKLGGGPVDVGEMNISNALHGKILAWDNAFQDTFNHDDPGKSGFSDRNAEEIHKKMGQEIADQLRTELPECCSVEFLT